MQRRSARWGARDDSDHAAGLGRRLKDSVSDHAARPSERSARIDSRDAVVYRTMQWGSDTGRTKGARTMQPVRPRGGTGNDSVVAVEF